VTVLKASIFGTKNLDQKTFNVIITAYLLFSRIVNLPILCINSNMDVIKIEKYLEHYQTIFDREYTSKKYKFW
jgi:hypothetical protein